MTDLRTLVPLALCLAAPPAIADNKILYSPHSGDATILNLTGPNSDKAVVIFRRELDDEVENCTRERGEDAKPKEIAQCVKDRMAREAGHVYQRRAFCARSTIYTEFGNFSMVNAEKEKASTFDGKPYRPIRTDWKDHRSGQLAGNCSACNTPTMLSTFKVLCPIFYDQLFRGLDPY